tara:strand:- start:1276 stop:1437 length:162 start_codon:yes stop_codon:yes gene_type:complete
MAEPRIFCKASKKVRKKVLEILPQDFIFGHKKVCPKKISGREFFERFFEKMDC